MRYLQLFSFTLILATFGSGCQTSSLTIESELAQEWFLEDGARLFTWKSSGVWKYSIMTARPGSLPSFKFIEDNSLTGLLELKSTLRKLPRGTHVRWIDLDEVSKRLVLPDPKPLCEFKALCKQLGLKLTICSDSGIGSKEREVGPGMEFDEESGRDIGKGDSG